jgi:hypothetical protein
MSKKCPICGRSVAVYQDYVGGTSFFRCDICGHTGCDFEDVTLFDRITVNEETLAESVVYPYEMAIGGSMFREYWTSPFVENLYNSKEEAIATTVAKLKEISK